MSLGSAAWKFSLINIGWGQFLPLCKVCDIFQFEVWSCAMTSWFLWPFFQAKQPLLEECAASSALTTLPVGLIAFIVAFYLCALGWIVTALACLCGTMRGPRLRCHSTDKWGKEWLQPFDMLDDLALYAAGTPAFFHSSLDEWFLTSYFLWRHSCALRLFRKLLIQSDKCW